MQINFIKKPFPIYIFSIFIKNTLVHAWPEFFEEKVKSFKNISAIWIAPNITNWDIEFV